MPRLISLDEFSVFNATAEMCGLNSTFGIACTGIEAEIGLRKKLSHLIQEAFIGFIRMWFEVI